MRTLFFFAKGGPGSGDHGHGGRPGERGGSAPNGGTRLIEQALIAHAAPWRVVPFSPAAWALEYHGFMCVTIGQDGLEIAVSASPRKIKQLARAVKEGAILTAGSALTGETASPGREDSLAKAVSYHHLSADDCVRGAFFVVCDAALFKALGRGHG
jgi:hypothetical protein